MTYIKTFFGYEIDFNHAVRLFSIHHLYTILVAMFAIFGTLKYAQRLREHESEKKIKYTVATLLITLEVLYHIHTWSSPYASISLPLHICSFATIMNITLLLTDSKRVFKYAFFFGTLGGFMALFIPFSYGYTYFNFRYYHFMVMHFLIMAVPIYYYKTYNFRVTYKNLLSVFGTTVILGLSVYLINIPLQTNYWYVSVIPPEMISIFPSWPLYITTFVAILFSAMNILYYLSHKKFEHLEETKKII